MRPGSRRSTSRRSCAGPESSARSSARDRQERSATTRQPSPFTTMGRLNAMKNWRSAASGVASPTTSVRSPVRRRSSTRSAIDAVGRPGRAEPAGEVDVETPRSALDRQHVGGHARPGQRAETAVEVARRRPGRVCRRSTRRRARPSGRRPRAPRRQRRRRLRPRQGSPAGRRASTGRARRRRRRGRPPPAAGRGPRPRGRRPPGPAATCGARAGRSCGRRRVGRPVVNPVACALHTPESLPVASVTRSHCIGRGDRDRVRRELPLRRTTH